MSRRIVLFAAAAALLASTAWADFSSLVRTMDGERGMHRLWTPGISLARLAVWMVHPDGVHDFQLVVYEGHTRFDSADFERFVRTSNEQPMIRVHSNRTGELALIWARPVRGGLMEMTILAHDPGDDTVVVRAVVDGEVLAREIADPRHASDIARR